MERPWMAARAAGPDRPAGVVLDQRFGHLGARAVPCAEEEHAGLSPRRPPMLGTRDGHVEAQPRLER
jgi:hypothetical protein